MTGLAPMAEIDLIPADYRNERKLLRTARMAGFVVLALACGAAATGGGLRYAAAGVRADVQRLQAIAVLVNQQRSTIAGLALRKGNLEAKLSLLEALRRDASLSDMLRIVGMAAPADDLWFLEWRLERLGAVVASAPAGVTTHFVIEPGAGTEPPAVRVQMTIIGHARDHAAVSAFVGNLLGQPGIKEVRVQRASREGADNLVEFDLLIVAHSASEIQ